MIGSGIRARETNNIVERLHGTLKDRLKPMRGLKNDERAKTLLNGYVINYNFCRKHQSINMTPAEAGTVKLFDPDIAHRLYVINYFNYGSVTSAIDLVLSHCCYFSVDGFIA